VKSVPTSDPIVQKFVEFVAKSLRRLGFKSC
jgi:hypothetical protein